MSFRERDISEHGSVGDWRLPGWVHRVPTLAWLFVVLAVVDVAFVLVARLDAGRIDGSGLLILLAAIGEHLGVTLLPVAVLAGRRAGEGGRPVLSATIVMAVGRLISDVPLDRVRLSDFDVEPTPTAWATQFGFDLVGPLVAIIGLLMLGRALARLPRATLGPGARLTVGLLVLVAIVNTTVAMFVIAAYGPATTEAFGLQASMVTGLLGPLVAAYARGITLAVGLDRSLSVPIRRLAVGSVITGLAASIGSLVWIGLSFAAALSSFDALGPALLSFVVIDVLTAVSSVCLLVAVWLGFGSPVEPAPVPEPGAVPTQP